MNRRPHLAAFGRAAYSLRVTGSRQRSILRFWRMALGRTLHDAQLLTQPPRAFFGQRVDQVLQHGPHSPHDLNALAAVVTNLCDGELYEVFPIRRAIDEPGLAPIIAYHAFVQMPTADLAEQVVNLVEDENRSGRVVDGRR